MKDDIEKIESELNKIFLENYPEMTDDEILAFGKVYKVLKEIKYKVKIKK